MEDFAAAAMMRLMQAGLAIQGVSLPVSHAKGPHVPLELKRDVVRRIEEEQGAMVLLRIGEALPDVGDVPLLAALEAAKDPHQLIDRWRLMEGYVHSKHRTEVDAVSKTGVTLRHISRVDGEKPLRSEDLLIFGLIISLIQWAGAEGVKARPVAEEDWAYVGEWRCAPTCQDCAAWRIEWRSVAETTDDRGALRPATLSDLVRADPIRRWTLGEAASTLAMSRRSLQRRLKEDGTSFSKTVADSRAAAAVRMIDGTSLSLGEIGFLSGYSDQAHFTRAFKSAMAVSPGAYMNAGLGR